MLHKLLDLWTDEASFSEMTKMINSSSAYRAVAAGLDGSARLYFMAALAKMTSGRALVVTADQGRAEKVFGDLSAYWPGQTYFLPSRELFINSDLDTSSRYLQQDRLHFFEWLNRGDKGVWVAPVTALLSNSLPPELWDQLTIDFHVGAKVQRDNLIIDLVDRGYERVALTEVGGNFSVRGDIIDIFPPGCPDPVRVELFDNIIESIRLYDPLDQRSKKNLAQFKLLPARELILTSELYKIGEKKIRKDLDQAVVKLHKQGENHAASKFTHQIERHLERLSYPEGIDNLSSYYPYFFIKRASLLHYLPRDFLVALEEPALINENVTAINREFHDHVSSLAVGGDLLLPRGELLWNLETLSSIYPGPLVAASLFPESGGIFKPRQTFNFDTKSAPYYHGKRDLFIDDCRVWKEKGYKIFLAAESGERGGSLLNYLREIDPNDLATLQLLEGSIENGYIVPGLRLAVVTEKNLLPTKKKKIRLKEHGGVRLSNYSELVVGDYVVHDQHGIGKYGGLNTLEVAGVKRDYLVLKYRGTDKLYIPADQAGLIQKYSAGDGPAPRLHSLGGGEWQRLKTKVNRSVEELARELLALYAARQAVEGHSFGPDHPWQQDFESYFPYEETADQLKAVADVKADLEKSHPMDRLICGDVGYGKTEVAMRAAFKVAMAGKQVAILVPTTVLAQQHHRTFSERFGGFPFRVAQLSRFVTTATQKEIINDLAAGKIDIIIGTHRLLSADISFRDLGLLVIDEEQRFGVRQKEKMKRMRLEVDTLAMTATPIPRTLHLSLSGGRDFSIIDTPPEDRYPVQTYVLEYSDHLLREAVQRELDRGGQVYIVFNRVDHINKFAEKIQAFFPEVPLAVGHGQLPEKALEKIMTGFQGGRYKILVSTTIIESGLDIPNVNTLIIYEADRFGLAQLYQIRGRVGRSNRLAYAYLTYRKDKVVSETAKKRLKAIKEFTELGSGFKIALRDLEIRGAGNILGAEQHGFIAAVGFDMYARLLEQAVAALKNEKRPLKVNTRIELSINAYLPASYIAAQDQKIDFYQRIYAAESREELIEIEEELNDRYGSTPEPVKKLLEVAELRRLAVNLGIEMIGLRHNSIVIQFHPAVNSEKINLDSVSVFLEEQLKVTSQKPFILKIRGIADSPELLAELSKILQTLLVGFSFV